MQELQTKLQATLAISNALTVIQNNLQKESALLMKITAIQSKAAAAAKAMEVKVTVGSTIAQKVLTLCQNRPPNLNLFIIMDINSQNRLIHHGFTLLEVRGKNLMQRTSTNSDWRIRESFFTREYADREANRLVKTFHYFIKL